jgi:hypothetical protein
MISPADRKRESWLDRCHARVAASLAPLLDAPTRARLEAAAAPMGGG